MNVRLILMGCVGVASVFYSSSGYGVQAETPRTLKEAFLAALQRSESLAVQRELLVQANEVHTQASAALFPSISSSFTNTNQETPASATGNALFPATQNTIKISATQPLFRGLRDFAALRQKKKMVSVQEDLLMNAARQLFYDVSTAFYNLRTYLRDVENYQKQIELNYKRLRELERFQEIGRSQPTDVLTFKANVTSLEAKLEASRGQVEVAREILAYLTGWDRLTALKEEDFKEYSASDLQSYLSKVDDRPDVKAALSNVLAYDELIPIARGGHLPSLDLSGNYYFLRPGALSDVNWDVSISLSIPLFQGGAIQSQVRQAESVARQYRLILSQTRRLAEQEVRTFYAIFHADQKSLGKLEDLVQISKKNYESQTASYRNGLVTNVDVLLAITTYQDAERQLGRQQETVRLDYAKLQAAVGERPEVNVETTSDSTVNDTLVNSVKVQ